MKSNLFASAAMAVFLFALPAFAGNEGPTGQPNKPPMPMAPFSLERDVTPGMISNGQYTQCLIAGYEVTLRTTQNGQTTTSYGRVMFDQDVTDLESEQKLIGEAYQGETSSRVGVPDMGTTIFSAQIGQMPPSKILYESGMQIVTNSSPAAQKLVSFISRNCDQVTTPALRQPIAQVQVTAPMPKFVPELFEIDADGTATFTKGGESQVVATLSQTELEELQAEIQSLTPAALVDQNPSMPNCMGGSSHEYRAFKQDGGGVVVARYQMCHTLRLPNGAGDHVYRMLGALENLVAIHDGAALPLLGDWGAPGANLTVGNSAVLIDMACARADINGVVAFDKNGHFEAVGTYTQEGGAYPVGGFHSLPARFSGQLNGVGVLELTIQIGGDWAPYTYEFHFGRTGHFARCA